MTPKEFAATLVPTAQAALERSKHDITDSVGAGIRIGLKVAWPLIQSRVVPLAVEFAVEIIVAKWSRPALAVLQMAKGAFGDHLDAAFKKTLDDLLSVFGSGEPPHPSVAYAMAMEPPR